MGVNLTQSDIANQVKIKKDERSGEWLVRLSMPLGDCWDWRYPPDQKPSENEIANLVIDIIASHFKR